MNWALVLVTAGTLQSVGYYDQKSQCQEAAAEWQRQGIKAGCVQQMSPEQVMSKMQVMIKTMKTTFDQ